MRAYTTTTKRWRRPMGSLGALALVIAVGSLVAPSIAGAEYSSVNAITGGSQGSSQPAASSDHSSVNSITGGSSQSSQPVSGGLGRTPTEIGQAVGEPGDSGQPAAAQDVSSGYSSLNAITGAPAGEPTFVSGSPSDADDGFDWLSAAIGAAAAMALAALGGAVLLTVRRRTAVSASTASIG